MMPGTDSACCRQIGLRDDFFQHCVRLLRERRSPNIVKIVAACCKDGEGNAVRQNQVSCAGCVFARLQCQTLMSSVWGNQDRVLSFVFEGAPELIPAVRHSLPTLQSDPFTANIHISDRMLSSYDRFEVPALDLTSTRDDILVSAPSSSSSPLRHAKVWS